MLVVDVGRGQEAIVFKSQGDAEAFLERHPLMDDLAQGMIPIVGSGDALAWAKITFRRDQGAGRITDAPEAAPCDLED